METTKSSPRRYHLHRGEAETGISKRPSGVGEQMSATKSLLIVLLVIQAVTSLWLWFMGDSVDKMVTAQPLVELESGFKELEKDGIITIDGPRLAERVHEVYAEDDPYINLERVVILKPMINLVERSREFAARFTTASAISTFIVLLVLTKTQRRADGVTVESSEPSSS
ncbi:MAG: hypothetical protein RIB60_02965 [Phycisphaerales bacterium]